MLSLALTAVRSCFTGLSRRAQCSLSLAPSIILRIWLKAASLCCSVIALMLLDLAVALAIMATRPLFVSLEFISSARESSSLSKMALLRAIKLDGVWDWGHTSAACLSLPGVACVVYSASQMVTDHKQTQHILFGCAAALVSGR